MTCTPITITFIFCLFIFRITLGKVISTCDKICITNSLRSELDGTYHFKYFNSTLNGAVYYNPTNQRYLHPYIESNTKYKYLIQRNSSISTVYASSSCAIDNPGSEYIFDPYDCFKGWKTHINDELKDDPNQRLVNCNNVTVSGNYRSGLDGTYEWLKFSFATNASIYRCKDCTMTYKDYHDFYLYPNPSPKVDSQWTISYNYSSIAGWSWVTAYVQLDYQIVGLQWMSAIGNHGCRMDLRITGW
eukprot:1105728_1